MYSKFLALALVFGIALGCDPREYNVYVQNNFACSNSDVEGRLAAGGSISIANYAIGCQIYNPHPETSTCITFGSVKCADHPTDEPSLVAGTSLSIVSAQIYAGSVVYGTSYVASSATTVLDCTISKNAAYGAYVRGAGFSALTAASTSYAAQSATGTVTNSFGTFTFRTTSNTAVFSISASDLASANTLVLDAPSTATSLIINVSGPSALLTNFGTSTQFSKLPRSILWNFPDATNVTISGVAIWGTILAPKADLVTSNGVFWGQVFVKSVSAPSNNCGQFNHAPFGSYVPPSGVCGNGVVDAGEQCDGGVCCKTDCTFVSLASNTTCRAAAGECDIPEICSGSSGACPTDVFYAAETPCGSNFGVCDVQLKEHCPGNSAFCKRAPPAYVFYWDAFNVVSFDSYTANGGDVEGRLAARNAVDLKAFTIGLETLPTDPISYYDLVVAGNAAWTDGSINKGRSGLNQGTIAVGGTFTAPDYLQERRRTDAYTPASIFDAAQTYYVNITNKLASLGTNAAATVVYGDGLLLTCSQMDSLYHVKVDAAVLSTTNWYLTSGCTFNAAWVIDVTGTGNVNFQGSPFSGVVERVIYNIPNGNSITANNGVAGNILAPRSTYSQTTGVTYGRLIVGNVTFARQNNKPNCIDFERVTITNKVLKKVNLGDNFVYVVDIKGYAVGDQVCISGNCRKVVKGEIGDIDGDGKVDNVVFVDAPFAVTAGVMSDAVTTIAADATRAEQIPIAEVSATTSETGSQTELNFPSGASALMVSSAVFAVVAMFF